MRLCTGREVPLGGGGPVDADVLLEEHCRELTHRPTDRRLERHAYEGERAAGLLLQRGELVLGSATRGGVDVLGGLQGGPDALQHRVH